MRIFFNFQKILFAIALIGTAVTCAVLLSTRPQDYNALFERAFEPFAAGAMGTLRASSVESAGFSLKMTVMASVWPLLSGSVGTIFSVNIGGEIQNVRRSQAYGMFGSLLVSTVLMVLLSSLGDRAFGREFQAALGRLPAAPAGGSLPVAPYFSLLAAVAAPHWSLALLICLGFAAWAFFWLPATLVYAARTLLAWSFDRVAPAPLGNVHPRWHTPTTALAVVVSANLIFLALFLFTDFFASLVLVLAAMLAWIPTMYAAIVFPYKNRRLFESSAIANLRFAGLPLMSIAGVLGLISVLILTVMLWNDSVAAGHKSAPSRDDRSRFWRRTPVVRLATLAPETRRPGPCAHVQGDPDRVSHASQTCTANWQPATFALDLISQASRNGLELRLIGSVAVRLRCEAAGLSVETGKRQYKDADLICSAAHYPDVRRVVVSTGFESDRGLEVATEGRRLLFQSPDHPFSLDLFVDELVFCHRLDVRDRLAVDETTLAIADLLLSKLQRVDLRDVDLQDLAAITAAFPLGRSDGEYINIDRITTLLSCDWGFCHTAVANLLRLQTFCDEPGWGGDVCRRAAAARSEGLRAAIIAAPKAWRWKLRSLIGEHLSWYQTVDAPDVF